MPAIAPRLAQLRAFYEQHLLEHILPFWLKHAIAPDGAFHNAVADDGTVLSTDRYLWSQGRALWLFSALCRRLRPEPRWRAIADGLAGYLKRHAPPDGQRWPFLLRADGSAEDSQSVYADAFAILGLTEYFRLSGDREALGLALRSARRVAPLLDDHATLPTRPHTIPPGLQSHGPSMIFAQTFHELGLAAHDQPLLDRALQLSEQIMTQHVKPERRLLYEFVRPGGALDDSDAGQTFLPGHAVESMWFLEAIYRHYGRAERIAQACEVMRWNMEKGWDEAHGGLFLACHAGGGKPVWHQPDAKVWWPQTEALYGLLVAHRACGAPWCLEWHARVHEYAFRVFPDRVHGEWHHYFDRENRPIANVIRGLQVKDPFHLPRALLLSIELLREIAIES